MLIAQIGLMIELLGDAVEALTELQTTLEVSGKRSPLSALEPIEWQILDSLILARGLMVMGRRG
jgi:hypothetical protein